MSNQFISEIRVFSFGFPPKGWAACNGQLLPIAQNQALFALLGTSYGGDGQTTFGLPDLRGGVAVHGGGSPSVGSKGGAAAVTLTQAQLPAHGHSVTASSNSASVSDPSNAYWATTAELAYSPTANAAMAAEAISLAGGNQPHQNMSPYLALSFCIALVGVYPPAS